MNNLLKNSGFIVFIILVLCSLSFAVEEIQITTYYPSPYGSYKELRAQRMALGDLYSGSTYCWPPASGACINIIDTNVDLVVEGNVGIGTITPIGSFEIKKASGNNNMYITAASNAQTALFFGEGDGQTAVYEPASSEDLRLWVGSADRVAIASGGNVGIGTTSPTQKLDVAGNIRSTGNSFCSEANEGANISFSCPANTVIKAITAEYVCTQSPSAVCPTPSYPAATSKSCMYAINCINRATCTFTAGNTNCGGDPCVGVAKRLVVYGICM